MTSRSTGLQFNIASPVISDTNANELISFTTTASAVNQINIANGATGLPAVISTVGNDTNIDLQLTAKGTGIVWTYSETAATNTVIDVARFGARSTGTPANGIGAGILFAVETTASNFEIGARIEAVTTDVTAASEDFDIVFKTMAAGAAAAERMRIGSTGLVNVSSLAIGGTTVTATAAELNFVDGVTSNVQTQLNAKANLASPTFTGVPAAPTATAGTNTTQVATTAFVQTALSGVGVASINVQEFTAGGTWTKPANALYSEITVVGGGQAGRVGSPFVMCTSARTSGSGGSSGGAALLTKMASALGATETVTIGAGGATTGASGGTSSFGAHASATGGGATGGTGSGTGAQAITGNLGGGGNTADAGFNRAETLGGASVAGPGGINSSAGARGGGGGGGDGAATFGAGGAGYVRVVTYCS